MKHATDGFLSGSADLQSALLSDPNGLPFRSELSLAPLIAFWTQVPADDRSAKGLLAQMVRDEVARAPELLGTIEDISVVDRHRELLDLLMAAVFAPASWEQEYGAAMIPFRLRAFYATPPARRLLLAEDGTLQARVNLDADKVQAMRLAFAYELILHRVYGIELDVEFPIIFTAPDPVTGLDRHFRVMFDWQFLEVETVGAPPELTPEVRKRLRIDIIHPEQLRELLPPDRFVLRGMTVFRAVEVTDQEVLSALKRDLIERESIVSSERFAGLQSRLRTLFRRPDLLLSVAALEGERVLMLNHGATLEHGCIFADSAHHAKADFEGTIWARTVESGRPLIIEDLTRFEPRTRVEDEVIEHGFRTIVVAPLHYQNNVIGTLTLKSPQPGALDATQLPKLHEVLPLFAMAVQRSMEEFNARIQAEIKEQFTAIHPVVEWRFRKAVVDSLERHGGEGAAELEPIVFENVHPLYALSDIRGSSTQRALAIQADLLAQLRLAREVVEVAYQERRLPALDLLLYRIGKRVAHVEGSLASGDEAGVVSFLRTDVESLFEHLREFGPSVRSRIDVYREALDPRLGVVYRQRRVFEDSVTRINETIASYVDLEEEAAQSMFPHYFEKQKTDGVDHQVYVGGALVADRPFDPLYVKNLRLWQFMVVCGIALRADQLTGTLPVPLQTTHLILVQHTPLSIRFRFDEKRFDVDGAYDIRYEIVKKRIDKALIRGTTERVTQPGKIAIVYSQPGEALEYRGYIEYLQSLGYLGPDVDDLPLEELQGVHGLRALRVSVALREPADRPLALDLQAIAGQSRN